MKKFLCLCLALVLLAAAPAVMAEDAPEESPVPEEAVIDVWVPASASIIVNPYRLAVETPRGVSREEVIGSPLQIINYSGFPVAVTAEAISHDVEGSGAVVLPSPDFTGGKELFLWIEFREDPDGSGDAPWSGSYYDGENQLAAGTGVRDVLTLPAAEDWESPGYGVFRVFGSAAVPEDDIWTAEDVVNVSIVFTFTSDAAQPVTTGSGIRNLAPRLMSEAWMEPELSEEEPPEAPEEPEVSEVAEEPEEPEEPETSEEPEEVTAPATASDLNYTEWLASAQPSAEDGNGDEG